MVTMRYSGHKASWWLVRSKYLPLLSPGVTTIPVSCWIHSGTASIRLRPRALEIWLTWYARSRNIWSWPWSKINWGWKFRALEPQDIKISGARRASRRFGEARGRGLVCSASASQPRFHDQFHNIVLGTGLRVQHTHRAVLSLTNLSPVATRTFKLYFRALPVPFFGTASFHQTPLHVEICAAPATAGALQHGARLRRCQPADATVVLGLW